MKITLLVILLHLGVLLLLPTLSDKSHKKISPLLQVKTLSLASVTKVTPSVPPLNSATSLASPPTPHLPLTAVAPHLPVGEAPTPQAHHITPKKKQSSPKEKTPSHALVEPVVPSNRAHTHASAKQKPSSRPKPNASNKPSISPVKEKKKALAQKQTPSKQASKKPSLPSSKLPSSKKTSSPKVNTAENKSLRQGQGTAKKELLALLEGTVSKLNQAETHTGSTGKKGGNRSSISRTGSEVTALTSDRILSEKRYQAQLTHYLENLLVPPEEGQVRLRLTLKRTGVLQKIDILSATSQRNRLYFERTLKDSTFPPFASQFPGEETHTFTLTLHAAQNR